MNLETTKMLVFVPGRPRTKGSFKVTRNGGVRPDNPDSLEMEERIRREVAVHWPPLEPSQGPFAVSVTAFFTRPKSHYGSGRNSARLKPTAPEYPMTKRRDDLDKIMRLVLDAMTGIVYQDDAQVVRIERTAKEYVSEEQPLEGVLIGVWEL